MSDQLVPYSHELQGKHNNVRSSSHFNYGI